GGCVHQGSAGTKRTGETDGADLRMLHESSADIYACTEEHGESSGRKGFSNYGIYNDLPSDFTSTRMGGMSFDNDGTSGGKRRCGVTATDRKGERKVACAENCYRPESTKHSAEIGTREGLTVG